MSSRVRRCDVAIGATVVHPVTGRPFEVTFNGYTSESNFASGWRTLRGTDLETGDEVTTIDIWELGVQTLGADDIEAAKYRQAGQHVPVDDELTALHRPEPDEQCPDGDEAQDTLSHQGPEYLNVANCGEAGAGYAAWLDDARRMQEAAKTRAAADDGDGWEA